MTTFLYVLAYFAAMIFLPVVPPLITSHIIYTVKRRKAMKLPVGPRRRIALKAASDDSTTWMIVPLIIGIVLDGAITVAIVIELIKSVIN